MDYYYRKMYEENCWKLDETSIMNTIHASFKVQYGNGKVSDVGTFLNQSVEKSKSTIRVLNVYERFLFGIFDLSSGHKKVIYLLTNNRPKIESELLKEQKHEVKKYMIECLSKRGKKKIAARLFGYLLTSGVIKANCKNDRELLDEWEKFMGKAYKTSYVKFLRNPSFNRNETQKKYKIVISDLNEILVFLKSIPFFEIMKYVEKDLKELEELTLKNQKDFANKLAKLALRQ